MIGSLTNPLFAHPAFAPVTKEIVDGNLGQILSVYASWRTKRRDGDPLADLGAPLLDLLLTIIDPPVVSVTATNERIAGQSLDAWFVAIRFADGLVATVDLGSFLPDAYPVETELRLEFCGTDRVVIVEPDNVAVTVFGREGTRLDDSYSDPWDDLVKNFAANLGAGDNPAMRIIAAARQSAATEEVVFVS